MGQHLQRHLRITHHLGCLAVHHAENKPIRPDGECRDDPYDNAGDEQKYRRHRIVEEGREEEFPTGKPPIVVDDILEQFGHLLSGRREGEHSRQKSGDENQGQNKKVRFEGPAGRRERDQLLSEIPAEAKGSLGYSEVGCALLQIEIGTAHPLRLNLRSQHLSVNINAISLFR